MDMTTFQKVKLGDVCLRIDDAKLGREHRGEVVLKKFLLPALQKLNPTLPEPLLTMAIDELTRDRSHLSLVNANHEIYKLLRDSASVMSASESGVSETERMRFFDFKNPKNNHFLCVSQLWITGEMYTRLLILPIFFTDEFGTTKEALAKIPFRRDRKKKQGYADAVAAQIILQRYLETLARK